MGGNWLHDSGPGLWARGASIEPAATIGASRAGGLSLRARLGGLVLLLVVAMLPLVASPARADEAAPALKPAPTWLSAGHELQADGAGMGLIEIPAIGLRDTLRSGVAMSVIDQGLAHWKGTSAPGGSGNAVIAGHRTTNSRPFYKINQLVAGDQIIVSDGKSNPAVYLVTETLIVEPKDIWITYETGDPVITLFACHPRGSARQRIVVRGALVEIAQLL